MREINKIIFMREINKIIVHCSATPNDEDVTVDEIRNWHVNGNGWDDIGYHYVIYRNGNIISGRIVSKVGAHCKGHNRDSIGVCLIGNDKFTGKQFDSLRVVYEILAHIFQGVKIYGHRDFNDKKTCPNFRIETLFTNQ